MSILDVNTLQVSGEPVAYYKNKFDVAVKIKTTNGQTVTIVCPNDYNTKQPLFTEDEFRAGPVSFLSAFYNHYMTKGDNPSPRFQLKTSKKGVLLNTNVNLNHAIVGGKVQQVNSDTNRFLLNCEYRKMNKGAAPTYESRLIMVTCADGVALPVMGDDVYVVGYGDTTEEKPSRVGVWATSVVKGT